jgi:hypothetical protein
VIWQRRKESRLQSGEFRFHGNHQKSFPTSEGRKVALAAGKGFFRRKNRKRGAVLKIGFAEKMRAFLLTSGAVVCQKV